MKLTYEVTLNLKWMKDRSIPKEEKILRHFLIDEESGKIFAFLWKRKDMGEIHEPWRVHLFFSEEDFPFVGQIHPINDGRPASIEKAREMGEEAVRKAWRAKEPEQRPMYTGHRSFHS